MAKKTDKNKYIYAVGRRKKASARVRLFKGKGENKVNEIPLDKYFPEISKTFWMKPFKLTETANKYYATIKVSGGGEKGQLGAIVLGIARALSLADKETYRPPLKKAGLLTRDARVKERRKVGTGGKARRKKQSPKR